MFFLSTILIGQLFAKITMCIVCFSLFFPQAMGVYLFGELIVSENSAQRRLAESCFDRIKGELETDSYVIVRDMIWPPDQDG